MGCATPSEAELGGLARTFFDKGWCRIPHDVTLGGWVKHALPAARATVCDPGNAQWLRCGGTWFAGVNVLPNDSDGAVDGGPPLAGTAVDFIQNELGLGGFAWDRAQVSVCYPGYPRPMEQESEAAFRYRRDRDAAHLDGLLREGPERRRFLREHHGFILGIPMTETGEGASPLVVWEGSHEIVRNTFLEVFRDIEPLTWAGIDVTEVYQALRRRIFDQCPRVPVSAQPGECYVIHRLALHGVAPWAASARAPADGRMVVYFRPETSGPHSWLTAP